MYIKKMLQYQAFECGIFRVNINKFSGIKNYCFLYPFFNKNGGLLFYDEKPDALEFTSDYVKKLALYDAKLDFYPYRQSYKLFSDFIPTIYSLH